MARLRHSILQTCLICVCVLSLTGCQNVKENSSQSENNEEQKDDNHPITIVVLDSSQEQLAALDREINKEFEFLELGDVTFKYSTIREFLKDPVSGDLIFYPPTVFGDLVKNSLIRKVPDYVVNADAYAQNDVLRQQRQIFCVHDDTRYAVSLGISGYFLMARVDILEKNGLQVPKTWRDYGETCAKLASLQQQENCLDSRRRPIGAPHSNPCRETGWPPHSSHDRQATFEQEDDTRCFLTIRLEPAYQFSTLCSSLGGIECSRENHGC